MKAEGRAPASRRASLLARVEAPQPEILSDSDLVSGDRLLPGCVVSQKAAVDAGL